MSETEKEGTDVDPDNDNTDNKTSDKDVVPNNDNMDNKTSDKDVDPDNDNTDNKTSDEGVDLDNKTSNEDVDPDNDNTDNKISDKDVDPDNDDNRNNKTSDEGVDPDNGNTDNKTFDEDEISTKEVTGETSSKASSNARKITFDIDEHEDPLSESSSHVSASESTSIADGDDNEVDKSRDSSNGQPKELNPCNSCEFPAAGDIAFKTGCLKFCKRRKGVEDISEIWLISVPKEEQTCDTLKDRTKKGFMSLNYKFHIPALKIGTLNVLLSSLESLSTLDNFVRDTTIKLCDQMKNELKDEPNMYTENLKVSGYHPILYSARFTWNNCKYPNWHSIPLITDMIFAAVDDIDKSFRRRMESFDSLDSSLSKYERRETESLQYRYLGDIVKKEHFVINSNYLTTLLVVVPNERVKQWIKSYENLAEMVVPQSSTKIYADETHSLFNVTLCTKYVNEFKDNARKRLFLIRDFKYCEESHVTEKAYYAKLVQIKKRSLASIFQYSKINFGECFEAWMHVKALRVFVESVLRFGISGNYQAMILLPLRSRKKLKKLLDNLYTNADTDLATGFMEEVPGALSKYAVEEYHPYVFLKVDLDFLSLKK